MQVSRRWVMAPLVVAALGVVQVIAHVAVNPYPRSSGQASLAVAASVGSGVYLDLRIPPDRQRWGAHLTGAHAVGADPGLRVSFVTTTYGDSGVASLGGRLACARGATRPVSGTPLRTAPDPVLRVELTPLAIGIHHVSSLVVDWAAGPEHGSTTLHLAISVRATRIARLRPVTCGTPTSGV